MRLNLLRQKAKIILVVACCLLFVAACSDDKAPVGKMPPVLTLGVNAPDFIFKSIFDSEKIASKLSHYQGKVIYLDFWASWCKPCLKSMPILNQMRADLADSGFEVIAVNLDLDPAKGKEFLAKYPVDYPVVRTAIEEVSELYKVTVLPMSYLIDRKGVLQYAHQGFNERDTKQIKKQALTLLRKTTK